MPTHSIQSADQREKTTAYFDVELDDAGLDSYAFRAYCRIARRSGGVTSGACTESVENMAIACKISRPTMVRALATLVRRNMIKRIHREGTTSEYALLDKSEWVKPVDPVNHRTTPEEEPGKPQNHPKRTNPVNNRTTPGKPQNHHPVNHRTTKKNHEVNKKEESIPPAAASAPKPLSKKSPQEPKSPKAKPAPKSPHHNHPSVVEYRSVLGYTAINAIQATMIAEAEGLERTECSSPWRNFLTDLASIGFVQKHNVRVVVRAFKLWLDGMSRGQAINQAFQESGQGRPESATTISGAVQGRDTHTHFADGTPKPKHMIGMVF